MLGWVVFFLIVALIAGVLGFGGIAATAVGMAKFVFLLSMIGFLISLIMHFMRSKS